MSCYTHKIAIEITSLSLYVYDADVQRFLFKRLVAYNNNARSTAVFLGLPE